MSIQKAMIVGLCADLSRSGQQPDSDIQDGWHVRERGVPRQAVAGLWNRL